MSRVAETIEAVRRTGSGALIGYLPVGFPDLDTSIEAAVAIADAGVDVIELGVPYSDPVMDGPVIQAATTTALQAGFAVPQLFEAIERISARVDAPVLVMSYWNLVLQYGVDAFAARLAGAGGAGLITPDLIPDEAAEWIEASERHALDRIFLAAPTSTEERLARISAVSTGFVYTVSTMGITGERSQLDAAARALVARLREAGAVNACVGIGISTAEQVREVLGYADGAIVGSALVRALGEGLDSLGALAAALAAAKRTR